MNFISKIALASMSFTMLLAKDLETSPGAISMSLNSTSINNIMNTFVPILAYYVLNNQTIEINETIKGIGYKLELDSVHIIEAKGFTTKIFENVPGTDLVHVKIGGVNISTTVEAELDALYFIPFKASAVNITNATLEFTLESTSDDGVHWGIKENTTVTVGKVDIEMKNGFLNWLVKQSSSIINKIIADQLPKISSLVDVEVEKIDEMLAQEGPYTFDVPILGKTYPLNLTMTTAPKIGEDLIQIYFDGLFHPAENATDEHNFPKEINSEWPMRFEHSHSEQFYIHESMINSLFRLLDDSVFPYTMKSTNLDAAVKAAFPELAKKYGNDVEVSLALTMVPNNTATPIQMKAESGIVLGSLDDVSTTVGILCSNSEVQNEEAVVFGMNMMAQGNLTMDKLIWYPTVDSVIVQNARVKKAHVQLQSQDFNKLFTEMLKDESESFNAKWVKGWSIANLDPSLAMITGLLKNTTMSPYIMDGWMYAGFGMQADLPTGVQELTFIQ